MGSLSRLGVVMVVLSASCSVLAQIGFPVDPAAGRAVPEFTIPPERPGAAYERFIVIGDMGTGHDDQRRVATAMAERAGEHGVGFILTVGDNIYPDGVESADDPQWRTKFETVYDDASLKVPVYATLGNHDHHGNVEAQVEYSQKSERWTMPSAYYTFTRTLDDETEVQFFAIDTTPIHEEKPDAKAQIEWLDEQLEKSSARWKIVYGHHPLYGHNPRRGHNRTLIAALEPVFVEHGVDVYFAGHDHTLEMLKPIRGVHYVISGAGAGPDWAYPVRWTDESYYAATRGGFVLCRIGRDDLVIEFIRPDGKSQYAHTLSKQ